MMRLEKPLALLLVMSAAACATPAQVKNNTPVATSADLHAITVTEASVRLEVPASGDALSPETQALVDDFGRAYRSFGHGPLVLSTPSAGGDGAARMAQATRVALVDKGVPYAAIAGASYDTAGRANAPIVLTFTRYEAAAPTCSPVWQEDLAITWDNKTSKNFGCSVNANLAAMIADPADLQGPRPLDPRDSARRDVVLDKYRNGDPTGAMRSQDERVAISKSVQ